MKTFCFRLYSSKNNRRLMRLIDVAGLIYNHCIALQRRYYSLYGKYIQKNNLQKHLVRLKKTKRFGYFKKLDAQAICDITDRIDIAYRLFWRNVQHNVKASPPKFRKIRSYKSFTLKRNNWRLHEDIRTITIQGQRYKYFKSRNIEGNIKTVTVKRDTLGHIYIFLVCDTGIQETVSPRHGRSVGYDFGLKKFLTASDGRDIESPLFFARNAKIIAGLSKSLAHKKAASKRRERTRKNLARAYKRASDQRRDFHYKTARKICGEYAVVCVESINIKGMAKLWGRKVLDLAFYSFMMILKHEASKFGTMIIETERFYPSSQICSNCGYKNAGIKDLRIRSWVCPECGAEHDRDRNAAINILTCATRGTEALRTHDLSGCP